MEGGYKCCLFFDFFRQICLPVYFAIMILFLNFENKSENTGKARFSDLSALHKIAKAF